jgi:putative nucleotidyltransferase with HDIG domain
MDYQREINGVDIAPRQLSIAPGQIIRIVANALSAADPKLAGHSERVTFLIRNMYREGHLRDRLDFKTLITASFLHDIGACEPREIDMAPQSDPVTAWDHAISGYVLLKTLTPLDNAAETVLYRHASWSFIQACESPYIDYAALLGVAERADILRNMLGIEDVENQLRSVPGLCKPEWVDLYARTVQCPGFLNTWKESPQYDPGASATELGLSTYEGLEYLQMLVSAIGFRSHGMSLHTAMTTAVASALATQLGLSEYQENAVRYAALLHDIGKLAVPKRILDKRSALTPSEWKIMQSHTLLTEKILRGTVPDIICDAAAHHHERLDGSGYPYGLDNTQLGIEERIVAVADVISALCQKRSYKPAFSKATVLSNLQQEADQGRLSPVCCNAAMESFDTIMARAQDRVEPIRKLYSRMAGERAALTARFNEQQYRKARL